jgi:hypothetical protein
LVKMLISACRAWEDTLRTGRLGPRLAAAYIAASASATALLYLGFHPPERPAGALLAEALIRWTACFVPPLLVGELLLRRRRP